MGLRDARYAPWHKIDKGHEVREANRVETFQCRGVHGQHPAAEVDEKRTVPDAQCRSLHAVERNGKGRKQKEGKKEKKVSRKEKKRGQDETSGGKRKRHWCLGVGIPATGP